MATRNLATRAKVYRDLYEWAPHIRADLYTHAEVRAAIRRYTKDRGVEVLTGPRSNGRFVRYDDFDTLVRFNLGRNLTEQERELGYSIRMYPFDGGWGHFGGSAWREIAYDDEYLPPRCFMCRATLTARYTRPDDHSDDVIFACVRCATDAGMVARNMFADLAAAEETLSLFEAAIKEKELHDADSEDCETDDLGPAPGIACGPASPSGRRDSQLRRAGASLRRKAGHRHDETRSGRNANADRALRAHGAAGSGLNA